MANPTLNERVLHSSLDLNSEERAMTTNGTIVKTCILGLLTAVTFAYNWSLILSGFADKAILLSKLGIFGAFALCLFICFAPKNKFLMITTPLYAMCEGLVLGYISALANSAYPGIASQAAIGTIFALFSMFILYKSNIIRCTDTFRKVLLTSTLAICGIYLLQIILGIFGLNIAGLFSNGLVGIGFSIVVVAIASFNLIIDFDMIDTYSGKLNKYFEWYCGFSLLVTIIWMYIEILNLLMKMQSRR
jgi:uncharacterized YccA/Bax inhibitor family protein